MKNQLRVTIGQYSCAGKKSVNQDFYGALTPNQPQLTAKGIAVALADGISSSNVSQIASETAVKMFLQDYYSTPDAWSVRKSGQRVLEAVNSWLYAQTQQCEFRFNRDKGYICTFSGMVFKSHQVHIFHAGDSRIYRLAGKQLEQLSTDHRRIVSSEVSYLTHGLGIDKRLDFSYQCQPLNQGDMFLLATDGVYEWLTNDAIARGISEALTAQQDDLDSVAKALVEQALRAGSLDNLTLQIILVKQLPDPSLQELHAHANHLAPAPSLQPRMQFDGYKILREIYISSRSHVYLAEDLDTKEKVALKIPSAEMRNNEAYLEAFFMEEWIANRLNNAHVLKAVKPTRQRHYRYTVTEYLEGKTLAQWIIDNPKPSIGSVRAIVRQIAKGLQAFHRQEMVHQDLRPYNVMIDEVGVVKIIDFGATKVAGITEITGVDDGIVGTAQYTAPEYFLGLPGTSRSDIFSLGVITYQMLCGELPYGIGVSKARSLREQRRLSYRPMHRQDASLPEWLDYAISKAVHVNPQKRYQDVAEFVYELEHPNANFMRRAKPPLLERDPVLFWQGLSLLLLCLLLWQVSHAL
ncbi:bifunctional protein-serine/threonine kinase/phosphatase [Simiduia curdlanivorans]|uniref:Protein kinase n=1 Tax=Simiduia curdlanivorans TaxID=1492769 RepID=A0ABV8V9U6_9GAMM|nr:bifunctional protein-serine/threonine kinase/phosphatase [Simiduia curdlanivorans]MDN3638815.1 bifunctional protein-serine/threonine kinase/phosphatase [Simiduia curdlanivorans]